MVMISISMIALVVMCAAMAIRIRRLDRRVKDLEKTVYLLRYLEDRKMEVKLLCD